MYSILEFPEEGLVGIVAHCWTYEEDGETYSYWPPSHQTKRAKTQEMPDQERWRSKKIRCFATTANWDRAVRWCRKAETRSSVETDEDNGPTKRPVKRPHKYVDESDDEEPFPKKKMAIKGPVPRMRTVDSLKTKKETLLPPPPTRPVAASPYYSPTTVTWTNSNDGANGLVEEGQQRTCQQEIIPPWAKTIQDTLEVLLRKVERVEENQRQILQLQRKGKQHEVQLIDLPVAQTLEELGALELRLEEPDFRKSVISHLGLVGGSNPGDVVRRVMRALASHRVWSSYSLRGKKDTVMKWNPGLGEKAVELLIGETLKHSPSAHAKQQKKGHLEAGSAETGPGLVGLLEETP